MSTRPGRLVLLGHPVAHSLSPTFQNAALRSAGIPLRYEALDVQPAALSATLDQLREERAAGNVTIPHKLAVYRSCDRCTPVARRTGAVNTFWCEGDALHGDNTDVAGFDAAARSTLGAPPDGARVALLGAGGGAAAVLAAVAEWRGASARVWSRGGAGARDLAARFGDAVRVSDSITSALHGATLVVNATPIGLSDDVHPAPLDQIAPDAAVIDLVYRPGGTPWVREARARGMRASDGLPMLVEQGALAFERWFGFAPDRRAMWAALG